jgi:hypothetical protein
MGKGFRATEGTLGQDLSELIMAPCRKRVSHNGYVSYPIITLTRPEPSCAYGLHHQRLIRNAVVTCLRGPYDPLRSHPWNWLQHLCPLACFGTRDDQV